MRYNNLLAAAATIALVACFSSSSAIADSGEDRDTVLAAVQADSRSQALSAPQEERAAEIIQDPRFGDPEYGEELDSDYPELSVETTSGTGGIGVLATGNRAYRTTTWKILGISYGSITTQANFNNSGAKVTKVNYCNNYSSNFLSSIRSVSGHSYHSLSSGLLTCKTDWVMKRIAQSDKRITQGFMVSGNGSFFKTWG